MARKVKPGATPASPRPPEFKVNPFADLRVAAAAPPKPPPAPPKPPAASKSAPTMDAADQALLAAFKDAGSIEYGGRSKGLRLEAVSRRGGRRVTHVCGLPELSMLEQMQITGDIRTRFGVGARFHERLLEVDGEQRDRLGPWLQARGYAVAPPD
jgi:translation initiation factor 1 (eIF-1/SUI1)